jgi:hypothetical protein
MKIIIIFNNDKFYKEIISLGNFYFSHLNLCIYEMFDIKYYTFELMYQGSESFIKKLKFYKEE